MSKARQLAQKTNQAGRKNLIINGAMQVAQRGTSFTTSGYTLDRLYYATSGATATVTQEDMSASDRNTYGFEHYAKLNTTTGNNNSGFYFKIEGKDLYHLIDNKFTFSFWAKGTNPGGGSLRFEPRWYDGTNIDIGTAQSVTLNSTWTKHTVTFEFPAITNASTTAASFQGQVLLLQPSTDTSTNAWELNITGVQLEVGPVATEFEHRSFGEELALCQRYFCKSFQTDVTPTQNFNFTHNAVSGSITAYASTAGYMSSQIKFPVTMRALPDIVFYQTSLGSTSNRWQYFKAGTGWADLNGNSSDNKTQDGFRPSVTGAFTVNQFNLYYGGYTAEAEL